MAASRNMRRLEDGSKPPSCDDIYITTSSSAQVEVSTHRSLCPAEGHFPYEGDCHRRSEKSAKIPVCPRGGMKQLWRPTSAPLETTELGHR
ncbi:hypothetical protein J6590_089835 [Homalodisca vitripennis]|nr:hypothetical protein J6590_089835 [Homalodisca vitripennis]